MTFLLRKRNPKASHQQTSTPEPQKSIRPSLSLPDLTSPLLDPASWEELPFEQFHPSFPSPNYPQTPATFTYAGNGNPTTPKRNRAPSLIGSKDSPTQFHRPFTPWQVVNTPNGKSQEYGSVSGHGHGAYDRGSVATHVTGGMGFGFGFGRKRKSKVVGRLNIVVVGAKGVGKTSFVRLLSDSLTDKSRLKVPDQSSTPSSPTSPGPPMLFPPSSRLGPTLRIHSTSIDVNSEHAYEKTLLKIVDTPGLEVHSAGEGERERGVVGLIRMLEERFSETLREERRVVRRQVRAEDELVHLILTPEDEDVKVDWSCVDVEEEDQGIRSEPHLSSIEIGIIRKLATRANVLPILTYTDTLTVSQLETVRHAVKRDLADLENLGFGVFWDAEDGRRTPTSDDRPPTPISEDEFSLSEKLPFAIFCPEIGPGPNESSTSRKFAWGEADVMDPAMSDFGLLRDTILGSHAKILRTSTREVLYENFRTEKLLAKAGGGD